MRDYRVLPEANAQNTFASFDADNGSVTHLHLRLVLTLFVLVIGRFRM